MRRIIPLLALLLGLPAATRADESVARYEVTFDATWSAETHPGAFPSASRPYFTGMIGGAHGPDAVFWEVGSIASPGIELVAEQGVNREIRAEVNAAIADGLAYSVISGNGIGGSPGVAKKKFSIPTNYALVTLVSMVAPSPDWFVGVRGLPLFEEGAWKSEVVVDLFPYDAGSDNGPNFNSGNRDARPKRPIALIVDGQLGGRPALGTFRFELLEILPACNDGIDNDGDGDFDYAEDMDCEAPEGTSEGGDMDADADGVPDADDVCPHVPDGPLAGAGDQDDADDDGIGDACECGDANADGFVDTLDARHIQRCAVGQVPCLSLCDANGDGECNTLDARRVQQYAVGRMGKDDLYCPERP